MPWKDPNGWFQEMLVVLTFAGAVAIGFLARTVAEVKTGERDAFFTRRLILDIPALVVMSTIAAGINVWLELPHYPATAVSVVCGYLGPRAIDVLLLAMADRIRGGK